MSRLSSKVDERPAMQFYLKDWLADTRILNLAERGLWIDALAFMFRAPRRGYLIMQNGCKPDTEALRNMFGTQNGEAEAVLDRILAKGVASRDDDGVIYCRRMAREADTEERKSELGRAAAEARWNAERMRNDGSPTPTPSPTPSPKGIRTASGEPDADDGESQDRPEPEPRKPRALNAQAQAVKDCLDAYVAGYTEVASEPFAGKPPEGTVIKWLGRQPVRAGAVVLFRQRCELAVKAHKLDPTFHAFPLTVPKFVKRIDEMTGVYLDAAKRNASKPKPEDPATRDLRYRAERCLRDNPGCTGGDEPACRLCAKTVKGSKL